MSGVGEREAATQRRVVDFFRGSLSYAHLGDWRDRDVNANIEEELLGDWLRRQGHEPRIVSKVLRELRKAAALGGSRRLYDANREVYGLLRYGLKVLPSVGAQTETVWLIDWSHPENNDFAVAEEVTVAGEHTKRPDLVLYVNGIALGVLELKRSTVSVAEGIRQNLDSQKKTFVRPFYSTVQLVLAGNETEGLRYGVIETPEKHWLRWKEADAHPAAGDNPLLRALGQLCGKARLLELVHDFMVFDAGTKRVRAKVKLASGDYIDLKLYEPAMRHLLDTYIRAEESERLSAFEDMALVQLVVERGAGALEVLPRGLREDRQAMAETIENNVRRLVIDEMAVNPKYYEKMSELLEALIVQRKQEALQYEEYLTRIVELTRKVSRAELATTYPPRIDSAPLRALYDNLGDACVARVGEDPGSDAGEPVTDAREELALALDRAIRGVKKADWRGNRFKEREVRNAIRTVLGDDETVVDAMLELVKAQREY